MPIAGGIKFFDRSKSFAADGATATASSNSESAKNILSGNYFVNWASSGSDDTTTETITITFNEATIDRIFLIDHNLKEYSIKYDVSGTPTDFTNVIGLDGAKANISETNYSLDTSYYEVDAVTTTKIYITLNKTQVPNQEKSLERFYATSEIGTLTGFPKINQQEFDKNSINDKAVSGLSSIQYRVENFECSINFDSYPAIVNDYSIIETLHDSYNSFLIWLCGGRYGEYFSLQRKGWRLKDVYNVKSFSTLNFRWNNNIYIAGVTGSIKMTQHIESK